jgi:integrase
MSFTDYAELWLEEYARVNLDDKNCYCSESRLKLHILPFMGRMKLAQIRTLTITKFVNQLSETINPNTGKRYSPGTIHNYMAQLSSMFSLAVPWELIPSNPCQNVIKPRIEGREIPVLSQEDSLFLLMELNHEPLKYQCLVYIGMMTGLRLGEIVGLKWSDIDFDSFIIRVVRSMAYVPKKGNFDKSPKTRTSRRVVSVPEVVISKLNRLQAEQRLHLFKVGAKYMDNLYVFCGHYGSPLGHNTPSRWFRRFIFRVRKKQITEQFEQGIREDKLRLIPIIRFHDLRHFHASFLLSEGIDLETVSKRLGHARTSTTANIYCHSMQGKDRQAANIMEKVLVRNNW